MTILSSRAPPNAARRALIGRLGISVAYPLIACGCGADTSLSMLPPSAERRSNIERDMHTTLARCNALAPHARAAFAAAVGVLVFPTLVATGVNGELAGDGALRVAQAVTGHYLLSATPAQPTPERLHSLIFLFMTFSALTRFQRAQLWPIGDPERAIPLIALDGQLDPRSSGAAVLAIAIGGERLLPALTFKDLRVTTLVV